MVLQYKESVSSISAESINALRGHFIDLMKTGLDLEKATSGINKKLVDHVCESVRKSGEKEKEIKEIEGWAQIANGAVGILSCAVGFGLSVRNNRQLKNQNRGIRRSRRLKNSLNEGTARSGSSSNQPDNVSNDITGNLRQKSDLDLASRTDPKYKTMKNDIGAAKHGENTAKINRQLDKRKMQHTEKKHQLEQNRSNMGIHMQMINGIANSLAQGIASVAKADKHYFKACYDAGVELGRNVIEGNRSIGQTEHDVAMKFARLTDELLNTEEALNRHHTRA